MGALLVLPAAPAQAQSTTTVTLSATATTVTEGETATVTVTLSAVPTAPVMVQVIVSEASGVTGGTGLVTIAAGSTSETFDIPTGHDADADDETFFVYLDTANLADGYVVGETTDLEFTIADDDKLTLTIRDDTGELQIGPNAGLRDPDSVHWVQVSPATARVTLTPTWQAGSVWATSGFSASVRYVAHSRDGSAITWSSSENGTGKQLELLTPGLGSPGYPRLTLTAGSISYVIQFQSNFIWETHNNNLLAVLQMRTSPQ